MPRKVNLCYSKSEVQNNILFFIYHKKRLWFSYKNHHLNQGLNLEVLSPARETNFHTEKKIQPIFKLENRFILITGIS